ncbi:DNA helicase PcrA [Ferroacidibacillus organovorans]|uniref:ATP-dependent DNA helicase n=1 Tax=Ferroacidibacillus organovorans TaxID=1765683 RepID=A0A162UCD9_9BACL|nr:DNA helicase PcrA [Ferroacidibacillus organovorans]KYP81639.1 ATP-dependent DNA helicase PcrA [Ferroacidibacillus organovorans]OAG94997.1 ATP-dependent DNA helicase PcrA [Ferroacidibacillus organovorans]OPG15047.1 DNA helicase PcrA [Ferroacidibacillus organovorans]
MQPESFDILEGLNPQQVQAVIHKNGPLLIVAGAGSGKTSVLTRRVAYLIEHEEVLPWSILAITFTNKAAREMKSRMDRLVGLRANDIWVSTFHAMCVRILRREIEKLGYTSSFTILDATDQLSAVRRCCQELNIDTKKFEPRSLLAAMSSYKNARISPGAATVKAVTLFEQMAARVYTLYQRRLKEQNALDFDDLIEKTVELFTEHDDVLAFYQRKFQYILVDEYQDTNRSQYELVTLLAKRHRNLCVVGDADQSIYAWRGADISNILSFEKDYPDAVVVKLEQNYRSTQSILDAANAVIKNNRNRPEKRLWTANEGGSRVRVHMAMDEREEARYLVEEAQRLHDERDVPYSEMAVLYRTNAQSRVVEELCLQAGIPYRVVGGTRFYERKEIKDVVAYLRLIANPRDDIAFSRIINEPRRGIGEGTLSKLMAYAALSNVSLIDAIHAGEATGLSLRFREALAGFAQMIETLHTMSQYLSVTELAEELYAMSGYRRVLLEDKTIESQARVENLDEFLSLTQEFDMTHETGSLVDFLTENALETDLDRARSDEDAGVTLMTLHSAKGLEFSVVFLIGMEEGIFPHSRAVDDEGEMAEERRLCYVGITRAKQELTLSCAYSRMLFGQTRANMPSRFLKEIPQELVEPIGYTRRAVAAPERMRREASPGTSARSHVPQGFGGDVAANWQVGDCVEHRKWGNGIVTHLSGSGDDIEITVTFDPPIGSRKLMVRFAPITKVEG